MKFPIKFFILASALMAAPLACEKTYSLNPSSSTATPTPAPCSGAVSFGNPSTSWDYSHGANFIEGSLFTLSDTAHITSINVYCRIPGTLRGAIYKDSFGAPGNLIAQTSSTACFGGWNFIPLSPSVPLSSGTYWLAAISSTTGAIVSQSGIGTKFYQSQTYGPFPATITSPTYGIYNVVINASYSCP